MLCRVFIREDMRLYAHCSHVTTNPDELKVLGLLGLSLSVNYLDYCVSFVLLGTTESELILGHTKSTVVNYPSCEIC